MSVCSTAWGTRSSGAAALEEEQGREAICGPAQQQQQRPHRHAHIHRISTTPSPSLGVCMHSPVDLVCLPGVSMLPASRAAVSLARARGVLTNAGCNTQQREERRDTGNLVHGMSTFDRVCLFILHAL
jgi:hypothetical protein